MLNSDTNSDQNSDKGNAIVNRYVFNRYLNELVDWMELHLMVCAMHEY